MKKILQVCLLVPSLLMPAAVLAQTVGNTAATLSAAQQGKEDAFSTSLSDFASNNLAAGEQALESGNLMQKGTPDWNMESARGLTRAAEVFRQTGNAVTSSGIAKLAVAQLTNADSAYAAASSNTLRSHELTFSAQIHLRYLGDRTTAKSLFSQALALDSTNEIASGALAWMATQDAEKAKKVSASNP